MKVPVVVSAVILIASLSLTVWMSFLGLPDKDFLGLVIGAWANAGALVSATFVVYGYLINVKAFAESQKPRVLLFVENAKAKLIQSGEEVHQTRIHYKNRGGVECEQLSLFAELVRDTEEIEIPRLFGEPINLQMGDSRVRDFPTKAYLLENGIANAVVNNLAQYKLRVGYKVSSLGSFIERNYDYAWDATMERWNIS